jgi:UDP-N-acetylmuramoyl-tripeptide--D-alanyl-D-alanine ligase
MPYFDPAQLARWTAGRWTVSPSTRLTGFAIDTRQVRSGEIFVALKTAARDGHDFLATALQAGAAAAIVSSPNLNVALPQLIVEDPLAAFQAIAREHRRAFAGPVIGVTGSAGKTSTKNLLALLLGASAEASPVLATEGNLNNHLGVPLTLTKLEPSRHQFAVIEAGISAPGDMAVLAGMIEPDVAITTLVAAAHIKELGSLDGVALEKSRLSAAVRTKGVAIYPEQCAAFPAFGKLAVSHIKVQPIAQHAGQNSRLNSVGFVLTQSAETTRVELWRGEGETSAYTLRRVTDGMAQNAAIAISAALHLGVSATAIQERLQAYAPAAMRGEWRRVSGCLLYLDCYNANPASMHDALVTFRAVAPASEPRLYVIGGMEELGEDAARHHRELGCSIELRAEDALVTMGDYADELRDGAIEQGLNAAQITVVNKHADIAAAINGFRGAIFIKGSRRYQLEAALGALLNPISLC